MFGYHNWNSVDMRSQIISFCYNPANQVGQFLGRSMPSYGSHTSLSRGFDQQIVEKLAGSKTT